MLLGIKELTFQTQNIDVETFRGFEAATADADLSCLGADDCRVHDLLEPHQMAVRSSAFDRPNQRRSTGGCGGLASPRRC